MLGGWFKKKQHEQVRQPHISDNNDAYSFRRSRTLTGSSSDTVRAAAEPRGDLRSERLKTHDLRKHRRKLGWLLLASLVIIGCLWTLLAQFIPSVSATTSGVDDSVRASYAATVHQYLSDRPSERFFFSLEQSELKRIVQAQHPEIRDFSLESTGFLQPAHAVVVLRQPIASWTIAGEKYYIDDQGVAFKRHVGTEPTLVVEDRTGIDPADAGAVASARMLRYTGRLVALVQQAGYTVEKVELPPQTSRQIDLRIAGKGYVVKTNLDRDPAGQAADVVNAVKYLESKQLAPAYVDVRVSSKAYYK